MRIKSILIISSSIFVISIVILGLGENFSPMITDTIPQSQDTVGVVGHVDITLKDKSGLIKLYLQGDNTVVFTGMDCMARLTFENSTSDVCPGGNNEFQFIAIGNFTTPTNDPPLNTETAIEVSDSGCADSGTNGEMARKQVTPTFTAATGVTGTVVILDTDAAGSTPFNFGASNSSNNITQAGLFNGPNGSQDSEGQCLTLGGATMFSLRNLATVTGIAVSDGDTLSVRWTITVG